MERVCFTFEIYEGKESEYEKRHAEIWPELVTALKECGFNNYSIFRRGLNVVGYVEVVPDSKTAFAKLGTYEVNAKWSEWFRDVILNLGDNHGTLMRMTEVWHLD
jgi:L-rhamnose mutarotase